MSEKPLHVQTAEALGWIETQWNDIAQVGRNPEKVGGMDGHGVEHIPRYDTDWSATGPLIEKYRLGLGRSTAAHEEWLAYVIDDNWDPIHEEWNWYENGKTPLIAICHLILALHVAGKLKEKP